MIKRMESHSPEETYEIGRMMARAAEPGDVFALEGDLGAGKTVFTKGFARELGVKGAVNSPTFTILQIYDEGKLPLYHFDVYRIEEPEEMEEIGFDDYIYGEGVCLIEWADQIEDILPEDYTRIRISRDLSKGEDFREIVISPANAGS